MREGTKRIGACTLCDEDVFDCRARWESAENLKAPARAYLAGQMKSVGAPKAGATRVTFLLASGEIADMTFCDACAEALSEDDYGELWAIAVRSWAQEMLDARPQWFHEQMSNSILSEVGRRAWDDLYG